MSLGKLISARAGDFALMELGWDDGFTASLNLADLIAAKAILKPLRDAVEFSQVRLSEDGWSVEWPSGIDFGAPQLRRWATSGFDERAVA